MNKIYIATLCLIMFSCDLESNNNKKSIKKIDSMNNLKTVYIVELDSVLRHKDTVLIEKYKKNNNGKKIYTETISFSGKDTIIIASYFNNNEELFFEKSIHSKLGLVSVYEYWNQNNEIERAISVAYNKNKVTDTIFIEYDKSQKETNKKTIVKSIYNGEIGNQVELFYNQIDLLETEIFIMEKDTLSISKYKYANNKLIEKIIKDFTDSIMTILYYEDENISKRSIYDISKGRKKQLKNFSYNYGNNGEIEQTTINFIPSNKQTILMHINQ
ncbi:MAG: hypothetical protein H0X63_06660 [Flavobacteriales bacterium]|nr:hypothetical protein [Flavobacteriales bacterium]